MIGSVRLSQSLRRERVAGLQTFGGLATFGDCRQKEVKSIWGDEIENPYLHDLYIGLPLSRKHRHQHVDASQRNPERRLSCGCSSERRMYSLRLAGDLWSVAGRHHDEEIVEHEFSYARGNAVQSGNLFVHHFREGV